MILESVSRRKQFIEAWCYRLTVIALKARRTMPTGLLLSSLADATDTGARVIDPNSSADVEAAFRRSSLDTGGGMCRRAVRKRVFGAGAFGRACVRLPALSDWYPWPTRLTPVVDMRKLWNGA